MIVILNTKIRHLLPLSPFPSPINTYVRVFINFCLVYFTFLLTSLSSILFQTVARMNFLKGKHYHIAAWLKALQQLPLASRIKFKFIRLSSRVHHVVMLALKSQLCFLPFAHVNTSNQPHRTSCHSQTNRLYSSHQHTGSSHCSESSSSYSFFKTKLSLHCKDFLDLIGMDFLYDPIASCAFSSLVYGLKHRHWVDCLGSHIGSDISCVPVS